jgi:hypothetical protein
MIEQIEGQAAQSGQAIVSSTGTNNRMDLDAMADQELQRAIQRLSIEIEERKAQRPMADLSWGEQVEWEAAIICAMYQRESLQFELLYRSIDHLGRVQVSHAGGLCVFAN